LPALVQAGKGRLAVRRGNVTLSGRPLSVLFDLRPAFDGLFGIPQETRLTFPLLHGLDGLDLTGLIHHPVLALARGRGPDEPDDPVGPAQAIGVLSRLVASATHRSGRFGPLRDTLASALNFPWLQLQSMLGTRIPLDGFDGSEFGDFLWSSLFFRTLPPAEFERCRTARYATLWPSWRALHATAFVPWPRRYARIDTSDYDVFLAQTPWPGTVDPRTRLVVRYHDSTPVFLPHTVKQPRLHQFCHMSALRANAETAAFACVSAYAQTKLLQIFPELGPRSFVVHDSIAPDYFPPSPARGAAADIVTSRIDASSEPQLGSSDHRRAFYDAHVAPKDFRFILMVSTLEPRKNHLGLLAAWEMLRSKSASPPALVLVGSPGWGNKNLLRAMQKWQQKGELFHLSAVPASEMRTLNAAADAVICPSVDEGFDLPAVEALCCGGAVAASDIPVHREILGDAAAFFDPYSTEGMCEALVGLLVEDTQQELRRKAVLRAANFDKSHTLRQWERVFDYCRANETPHAGE